MEAKKVVIIGGGISGLTAGVYARLAGFEAEIYEKNAIPGGECIGWNRKGYHIDNCIHWLTGTRKDTELYNVWKTVGALSDDTEYAALDAFYSSTKDGRKATLWCDLKRTEKELIELSPEDEAQIRHFIESVEISKQCLFPAEVPTDLLQVFPLLIRKAMGKRENERGFPKASGVQTGAAVRFQHRVEFRKRRPADESKGDDPHPQRAPSDLFLVKRQAFVEKTPVLRVRHKIIDKNVHHGALCHLSFPSFRRNAAVRPEDKKGGFRVPEHAPERREGSDLFQQRLF